jgi:hypothetical protein
MFEFTPTAVPKFDASWAMIRALKELKELESYNVLTFACLP